MQLKGRNAHCESDQKIKLILNDPSLNNLNLSGIISGTAMQDRSKRNVMRFKLNRSTTKLDVMNDSM